MTDMYPGNLNSSGKSYVKGKIGKQVLWFCLLGMVIVIGIVCLCVDWTVVKVVEDKRLYMGRQLDKDELQDMVDEYGIKTIVSMVSAGEDNPFVGGEVDFCREKGIVRYHFIGLDGGGAGDERLYEMAATVLRKAEKPIYFHCVAGNSRSSALLSVYRMRYDNKSYEEVIEEILKLGWKDVIPLRIQLKGYWNRWVDADEDPDVFVPGNIVREADGKIKVRNDGKWKVCPEYE